ncbi:MAG: dATP/dGTP diphosphohydrolase domain-containing protein [Hominilimicola sp.]
MTNTIKDSGNRTVFATGSVRDMQEGKGRMDLLPHLAIIEVSKHCEAGAKKYGEHNVDKGIPLHSLCDSAARHLFKFMHGETDENHLVAAAWNLLWAIQTRETHPELTDIPAIKSSEACKEEKAADKTDRTAKSDTMDSLDKLIDENEIRKQIHELFEKMKTNFVIPGVGECCCCGKKDCDIPFHPEWKDKKRYFNSDYVDEWDDIKADDCLYEVKLTTRMVTFNNDDIGETGTYHLCGKCVNALLDYIEGIGDTDEGRD